MDPEQAIMEMKDCLEFLYADVRVRGSGRAKFVVVHKALRAAGISVASNDTDWNVELWQTGDQGEEELRDDRDFESWEEAIDQIRGWLDG